LLLEGVESPKQGSGDLFIAGDPFRGEIEPDVEETVVCVPPDVDFGSKSVDEPLLLELFGEPVWIST
jgi:hypothetical protein